jgi:hypothetical protein
MKIDGRCHCGYVTFEAEADPETVTVCNCTDCQTMSGAPLRAVVITRPGAFVLLSGKPTEYRKTADSGNVRVQGFCPHCGTALYATSVDDGPKAYNVRLGALRQRNELSHGGKYLFAHNRDGLTTSAQSRNLTACRRVEPGRWGCELVWMSLSWHLCDMSRSRADLRFRWKSGRAVDLTTMTEFD